MTAPELVGFCTVMSGYSVAWEGAGYTLRFDRPGNYNVYVMNPMGQLMARKVTHMESEVQMQLPKGVYIFRVMER